MMRFVSAFVIGTLFGLGLAVSGMMNPAKVIGFLDILGAWDPTLAFVMAGALIPMTIAWRVAATRTAPVCASAFPGPPADRAGDRQHRGAVLHRGNADRDAGPRYLFSPVEGGLNLIPSTHLKAEEN